MKARRIYSNCPKTAAEDWKERVASAYTPLTD